MLPIDRSRRTSLLDNAPHSRSLSRFVAVSTLALAASAASAGCGDDNTTTTSSSDSGGGTPTSSTTTSSTTASGSPTVTVNSSSGSQGTGGEGASSQSGGGGSASTSSNQGGAGQGGDTSAGGSGQGGATTGGAGGQGGATGTGSAGGQGGATGTSGAGGQGGSPFVCTLPEECDDGLSCTVDACDNGTCVNTPDHAACEDPLFCNGVELCDPVNGADVTGCAPSSGSDFCDDGLPCTTDTCDDIANECGHVAVDSVCDDGIACNGTDSCSLVLGCVFNDDADACDDGLSCTDDVCSSVTGACEHIPQSNQCDNGQFCDGVEQCNPAATPGGTGCEDGANPSCNDGFSCTTDSCNEATDGCTFAANDAACSDSNVCDGIEACDPLNGGAAVTGCREAPQGLSCNDNVDCTVDTCDAQSGCANAPNDAACGDGTNCDGINTCDAVQGCVESAATICPNTDNIACTVEACVEPNRNCASTPTNAACPAGQFCIAGQGCVAGVPCDLDSDCDDGNACNGDEFCDGVCQSGIEVTCDDGVACTFDSCVPATGACTFAPNNDECSDGNACNGTETCNAQTGCTNPPDVVCDDSKSCTANSCNPATGACVFAPNNAACSDGNVCNGTEVCSTNGPGATGCAGGTPLVCPNTDGIACTVETCEPGVGCVPEPNDSLCPCGQTCSAAGCGNFCQIGTCQGKVYQCGDCVDNDGDCRIDSGDTQCLGTCDNTENSFFGGIPGQNNSPCKSDCYFDQDTGAGNDECYWSHKCDPLEVAPNYPPEGSQCEYSPNANIPGYNGTCAQAFVTQSAQCADYCGPLTPNGCDCFGCCAIPGAPTTVWLGSEVGGNGSCNINTLANPSQCKPCTQVPACLNTCETCEICVGKPELPPECGGQQQCPAGIQACGLAGQAQCPAFEYCVTGCCQPVAD